MISQALLPVVLAILLTPSTARPSVDAGVTNFGISSAFECEIGSRHVTAANCFHTSRRYVACFHLGEQGALEQVSVVPEDWLGEGQFDRDRSLSAGEYLQILSQVSLIRSLGRFVSSDRARVHAVLNNVYDDNEEWEDALVMKYVNAWDESVLSFTVFYYRAVAGRVIWHQPKDCTPDEVFGPPLDCRDPSLGPTYLSVDGHDYYLAPAEQKTYKLGTEVNVLAADPDQGHQSPRDATGVSRVPMSSAACVAE